MLFYCYLTNNYRFKSGIDQSNFTNMCGIFAQLYSEDAKQITEGDPLLKCICNRGPDSCNNVILRIDNDIKLNFWASVLWMQGIEMTSQPVENENGVLLFNGDIFDETWDKTLSDTSIIMRKIQENEHADMNLIKIFKSLRGPFSIIYYDKKEHNLFFLRDRLGRNSLIFYKNDTSIIISSVTGRNYTSCVEVPATHIIEMNITTKIMKLYSWSSDEIIEQALDIWWKNILTTQSMPDEQISIDLDNTLNLEDPLIAVIQNISHESNKTTLMQILLENKIISNTVEKMLYLLNKSIKIRLESQPNKCKDCIINKTDKCSHCSVGILFSGGLDCTVLAVLADKYTDTNQSIDLMNVAFEKEGSCDYNVPDRITGRQSYEELKTLCPNRKWNFMEINVTRDELEMTQRTCLSDLVYPRQTILDESLGSAMWFASRGVDKESTSGCRILLLGSGADELFGGYSRHRNAFKYRGWTGLHQELMLDWKRISFRNLARDNRVICDHGRQPRLPYLDEDFSTFILNLPPWLKCYPCEAWGAGTGDKYLLRLAAYTVGLRHATLFPKRALQFGSRIANRKERGSDISRNMQRLELK